MTVQDFAVFDATGVRLGYVTALPAEALGRARSLALRLRHPLQGIRVEPARRPPPPIVPRLPRRLFLVAVVDR